MIIHFEEVFVDPFDVNVSSHHCIDIGRMSFNRYASLNNEASSSLVFLPIEMEIFRGCDQNSRGLKIALRFLVEERMCIFYALGRLSFQIANLNNTSFLVQMLLDYCYWLFSTLKTIRALLDIIVNRPKLSLKSPKGTT